MKGNPCIKVQTKQASHNMKETINLYLNKLKYSLTDCSGLLLMGIGSTDSCPIILALDLVIFAPCNIFCGAESS